MEKVRWGVLGLARIATGQVIPALLRARNAELVAVASRNGDKARQFAEQHAIDAWYADYDALLNDPHVDAVYIPLPNHLHAKWTVRAAEKGKHVLCEKPAALTAAQAIQMIETCDRHGVLFMEAFMYQFHRQWERVRAVIESGEIGQPRLIRSAFSFILDNRDDVRWSKEMGGGALYDVGCYCVHVSRMLAGGAPDSVRALARFKYSEVDTTATVSMKFTNGLMAQFDCSFELPDRQRVEVVGTKGAIEVSHAFRPDQGTPVIAIASGGTRREEHFEGGAIYVEQVEHFGECILHHEEPQNRPQDTILNMQIIDEIHRELRKS